MFTQPQRSYLSSICLCKLDKDFSFFAILQVLFTLKNICDSIVIFASTYEINYAFVVRPMIFSESISLGLFIMMA